MSNMGQLYQEVMILTSTLKVNKRVVKHVELLNERQKAHDGWNGGEPIEVEQFMDQLGASLAEEFKDQIPPDTLADKIKRFKSDVGDEIWQDMKNNPNIQEIVEKHISTKAQSLLETAVQRLLTLFSEADQILVSEGDKPLTAEDVKYAFLGAQKLL